MVEIAEALRYYAKIMNERVMKNLEASTALCEHRAGVFTYGVTVWLMIYQRLHPRGSLIDALNYQNFSKIFLQNFSLRDLAHSKEQQS